MFFQSQRFFVENDTACQVGDVYIKMVKFAFYFHCCYLFRFTLSVHLIFALWFTNDTCDYRVNPPIRTADDVEALVEGIRTGIVDAIATDHAPHSEEDKLKGMAGMVGSETAFGVCYTKLCKEEGLPLELLSHLMSTRPAEILGLAKEQLEPGYDADFVLVDLDTPYTVDKNKLHSKSHNCPFDGAQLYGRVCATVKGGELTYQAEE